MTRTHDTPHLNPLILIGPIGCSEAWVRKIAFFPDKTRQIAVDGGIRNTRAPHAWMGDGDSGPRPDLFKNDQNLTDFRFCLDRIRSWEWSELHLFGFLGGRRDHELANLGEVHAELKTRSGFEKAVFYAEDGSARIEFRPAGTHETRVAGRFSILVLEPARLTLAGDCAFIAENIELAPLSGRAISNRGSGRIRVSCSSPWMLVLEPEETGS